MRLIALRRALQPQAVVSLDGLEGCLDDGML